MNGEQDRTVVRRVPNANDAEAPPLTVSFRNHKGEDETRQMTRSFRIGRDPSCEIRFRDDSVSRFHAAVRTEQGAWHILDLNSSNGVYSNGERINKARVTRAGYIQLGVDGPIIRLSLGGEGNTRIRVDPSSPEKIYERYFGPDHAGKAGQRTMLVRRLIDLSRKSQARRYGAVIGSLAIVLSVAIGAVVYQHLRLERVRNITVDIFYNMKELELQVADLQERIRVTRAPALHRDLSAKQGKLDEMQARYDALLSELGVISPHMSAQDKMIFHVARILGECEINMPAGFVDKVKAYIEKWRATDRLPNAIAKAHRAAYTPYLVRTLMEHDLPPQFFYLALQESSFNDKAVGPRTRFGIAKGIWQFIPGTAKQYGLRTGPFGDLPRYDPQDERFNFRKATQAAAKYLKYMYSTEAQASGLLVIASYNWGDTRVRDLIRKMPQNPRQRNFWELLNRHRIPKETLDYVFYIVSAAVIGENPSLFGYRFVNPLRDR